MLRTDFTSEDRAMAALVGASRSPLPSQPSTPSRRNNDVLTVEKESSSLPLPAYYIIFVEGCERFCYYGLRAVLLLYFMNFLGLNKDSATVGYHLFLFACYFTPTIGAIIADGFIGRYLTILTHSILYFIGTIILTITAIPHIGHQKLIGPVIGLLLIAIGTGGVKPCVNAFGADQIAISNQKQLNRYFSFFYFAINIGSVLSMVITPILRSKVECFGYDCYSLAFGVPLVLMFIAIVIFIIGTPMYKRVLPKENVISQFIHIIWRAIRNALFNSTSEPKEHWIYYADDKYSTNDIEDVRRVLRIMLLFAPLPIYHALYDQQGSRWTYQASLMDGNLGPIAKIQPDQMQALNSLLILLFIPLFEKVVYPVAARFDFLIRPLQRIFCGMILMFFAFIVAAMLQQSIYSKENAIPVRFDTNIYNGYNCTININDDKLLERGEIYRFSCTKLLDHELFIASSCTKNILYYKLSVDKICPSVLIVSEVENEEHVAEMGLTSLTNPLSRTRGVKEFALLRVVALDDVNMTVTALPNKYQFDTREKLVPTEYQSVLDAKYRIKNIASGHKSINSFPVSTTAVYTVLLVNTEEHKLRAVLFEDVPSFTVHMLWQSIQYILLSAAEILLNVTCLIFAYAEAPKRYKVVIMSAWLLTTAFGDLLVVFIAGLRFADNQAMEFVLFAIFMAFATFVFGVIASRYKTTKSDSFDNDISEDQKLIHEKNVPKE